MNIKVIIYWQDEMITAHSTHFEDLEELLLEMVLARDQPFLKVSILNVNFPKSQVED